MKRILGIVLTAALVAAGVIGITPARAVGPEEPAVSTRKNVKHLTETERADYVAAVLALKAAPSPYDLDLTYYDQFVVWHEMLYRCTELTAKDITAGHNGPFFLPWHRAFLLLFERALREVSGKQITLPYWDWTDPASTASVFRNDFMGGEGDPLQGYAVTTGPFRKGQWTLNVQPEGAFYAPSRTTYLTRRFGSGGVTPLPSASDVAFAMSAPRYDVAPYDTSSDPNVSFRAAFEGWWRADPSGQVRFADPIDHIHCGPDQRIFPSRDAGKIHNQAHSWTGGVLATATGDSPTLLGTMLTSTSPNDPTFFLHHANLDRLWAQWQSLHGGAGIEPVDQTHTAIQPFAADGHHFTPDSVNDIADLGYAYATDNVAAASAVSVTPSAESLSLPGNTGVPYRCVVNAGAAGRSRSLAT